MLKVVPKTKKKPVPKKKVTPKRRLPSRRYRRDPGGRGRTKKEL